MRTVLTALRTFYGGVLLFAPDDALQLAHTRGDSHARAFARVLGVRQLAEAAVLGRRGAALRAAGAGVDAIHAASVLVLARRWPSRARALRLNAAVAATLAALGAVAR